MAYVALKQLPGPDGVIRRPGDHVPEADAWLNPKLWVEKGHVRWVPNSDIVDGRWKDFEEFVSSGAGGRVLQRLVGQKGAAQASPPASPPAAPPAPPAEVKRLPPLEEYVRLLATGEEAQRIEFELAERARRRQEEAVRAVASPPAVAAQTDLLPPTPAPSAPVPAPLPPIPPRKELEAMSQQELVALAESRGLPVDSGAGKGKLIKLLSK